MAHKNYLVNTAAMWGVACVLPVLLGQMEARFVLPIGFAILSLNTPICILLSCDPALERAVRFLPGQGKTFCVPYCLFIFGGLRSAECHWLRPAGVVLPHPGMEDRERPLAPPAKICCARCHAPAGRAGEYVLKQFSAWADRIAQAEFFQKDRLL